MSNELEIYHGEQLPTIANGLEQINRSEIDIQISTAHRFPRSQEAFLKRAVTLATIDEETAASCIYNRPVGKENGRPVFAEGMSIRLAEIVASCFGNIRVGATIISQTPKQVVVRGMAHDLETNFATATEVVESTVDRYGKPYSERMQVVAAKAALAKARRDATFQVIPKALALPVMMAAKQLISGNAKSIEQRRTAINQWISTLGIPKERVFAALGVVGIQDIGISEMETLTGLRTAIKNGDVSIDDAFPESISDVPVNGKSKAAQTLDNVLNIAEPVVQKETEQEDEESDEEFFTK
ncbi:hypothetical protein FACS1894189_3620 [Planctomycetales bacterium]|nr:hypothetical protein FACS1894189_3620 [Planctomycetales bacterium]